MKIKLIFFFLLLAIVASLYFFKDGIAKKIAIASIKKIFLNSQVEIEDADLDCNRLVFKGLSISNNNFPYKFSLGKIQVAFSPISLMKKELKSIEVKNLNININSPNKTITDFLGGLRLSSGGGLTYREISAEVKSSVNLKEVSTDLSLSALINLNQDSLEVNKLKATSLFTSFGNFQIKFINCDIPEPNSGKFSFGALNAGKIKIAGFKSAVRLEEKRFVCEIQEGKIFNGGISGKLIFDTNTLDYDAGLRVNNLDLVSLTKQLEIQERIEMSGLFDGDIGISGQAQRIKGLKGNLKAHAQGGRIKVKDESVLRALETYKNKNIQLTLDILEDFKFDKGVILIEKDADRIIFNLELEGEQGRINIPLVLHNFLE